VLRHTFGLGGQNSLFDAKYILAKDTVLRPLHDACVSYSEALLKRENAT